MPFLHFLQPIISPLSAILVALLVDILLRLLAGARDRLDPLLGIPARMSERLESKLNRRERDVATRASRGMITLLVMLVVAIGLAGAAMALQMRFLSIEPLLWFLCFHVTFAWTASYEMLRAWRKSKSDTDFVAAGLAILQRRRVPVLVATKSPDRHGIVRMMIEAMALSLHSGLLSPVLWGLAASMLHKPALPVAIFVVTLLEAERIIATLNNRDTPFAKPFQVIETIINFVPARIAALLYALAAFFTPGAHPGSALRSMFVQSEGYRHFNAGWPVAAVAGALRIALPGGKRSDGWIGPKNATARAGEVDLQRALFLHIVACGLFFLILTALLFIAMGS